MVIRVVRVVRLLVKPDLPVSSTLLVPPTCLDFSLVTTAFIQQGKQTSRALFYITYIYLLKLCSKVSVTSRKCIMCRRR